MDKQRYEQAREIFEAVMGLEPSEREGEIARLCGDDAELRADLESLFKIADGTIDPGHLLADAHIGDVRRDLESLLDKSQAPTSEDISAGSSGSHASTSRRVAGASIGAYTIERLLGEGGMGAVYLARQERPSRTVALKLMRPGFASERALRRFEHEADVLGRLQHPGIAQVYEAGMHEGAPFFAMEYIDGPTLSAYASQRGLSTDDRLRLFVRVCEAVHHAHAKGVIHRDLKPANILVAEVGEPPEAQPKVLDFGVARATDSDIHATSMHTEVGQIIGTLPYMSPEQVAGETEELDTRSDVYALGVVLYELLAERLPYDLEKRLIHEAARVIREEEPSRLSMIDTRLRGDVETIVGKALEKERDRRYQSALDLAGDVRRYLSDEPISARPPSTWYQLQKFSRRHRTLVGGVVATFVMLIAGVIATSAFAVRADSARRDAVEALGERDKALEAEKQALAAEQERAEQLQQVADFQTEQLGGIDPPSMGLGLREGLRERLGALAERRRLGEAETEALLAGYDEMVAGADFTGLALDSLQEHIFERSIEAIDTQFEDQPLVQAQLLQSVAVTLERLGLLDLATGPQERSLTIRREQLGGEHPDTLTAISNMGLLLRSQGKLAEAEPFYREALEGYRRVLGDEHPHTLISISNMGYLLRSLGKPAEAEPFYRESLEAHRRVLGDEHPDTLISINNLGGLLRSQGKLAEAEPYHREALETKRRVLGDEHPSTLISINNLGGLLDSQGKLSEAEPYYREALETKRRVLGDEHPSTLNSINNLGGLLDSQGRLSEAELYYREALEARRRVLGDEHVDTLVSINNMGSLLRSQGQLAEAELYYREALEGRRRVLGDEHPHTLVSINNMGSLLRSQGQLAEAELYFREALETKRRVLGDEHPSTLTSIHYLAGLTRDRGDLARAEVLFVESVAGATVQLAETSTFRLVTTGALGDVRSRLGAHAAAEPLLLESQSGLESTLGAQHDRTIKAIEFLIGHYDRWHEAKPGEGHDAKAVEWRAKLGEPDRDE